MPEQKKNITTFFNDNKELFVFIGIFFLFYITAAFFDFFEIFHEYFIRYEHLEIDEIFAVSTILFFAIFIFFLIRSSKLRKEIKAREEAEEELQKAAQKISLMLEYLPIALYISKTDGDYGATYISDNIEELCGFKPEIFTSDSSFWVNRIHPDHKNIALDNVSVILEKGYKEYEYLWKVKNGKYRWFYDCAKLIKSEDGKNNFIIGMWLDITNRKEVEEKLSKSQKLESLGILAGGIAHDFNNLLASIMSNLSVAKSKPNIDRELLDLFTESEEAAIRASELVSQLLTFSKGGAPVKKPLDNFSELVRTVADYTVSGSMATCVFDIEKNLWDFEADRGQISQVIQNLVMNAEQAMTDRGVIKISLSNHFISKSDFSLPVQGKYIRITIEDSGKGIPDEDLQKIFDPYFTTKNLGHGLGLSSVYSIVKNHDGYIDVESEPGVGTKFHVYLPSTEKLPEKAAPSPKTISGERGRILFMDDENLIKIATGRMLNKLGYEVDYASDGEEAVELYKRSLSTIPYDLVIMDLTVPGGMGGVEATKILKSLNPEVKVIVSSGYSDDPVMSDYKEYGFTDVVKKPYQLEVLSSTIDGALSGRTH